MVDPYAMYPVKNKNKNPQIKNRQRKQLQKQLMAKSFFQIQNERQKKITQENFE